MGEWAAAVAVRHARWRRWKPGAKKLPAPTGAIATVMAACGKAKKTIQAPLPENVGTGPIPGVRLPSGMMVPSAKPELAVAVKAISVKYRDRLPEMVKEAGLPHDLPELAEMFMSSWLGVERRTEEAGAGGGLRADGL